MTNSPSAFVTEGRGFEPFRLDQRGGRNTNTDNTWKPGDTSDPLLRSAVPLAGRGLSIPRKGIGKAW